MWRTPNVQDVQESYFTNLLFHRIKDDTVVTPPHITSHRTGVAGLVDSTGTNTIVGLLVAVIVLCCCCCCCVGAICVVQRFRAKSKSKYNEFNDGGMQMGNVGERSY